ncbi:hypothetical protein [Nonomuraea sp. B19D2]|uniref:hypothetical protein n=1 Tax=Nonomuraea sp. B19D2 TaxID=3159561 RepID=UPI0032DB359E
MTQIASSATTVETGRDYQIKIQVTGRRITTWQDGQKLNDFVGNATVEPLYQVVSREGHSVTFIRLTER